MAHGKSSRVLEKPSQAFLSLDEITAKLTAIKNRLGREMQLEIHSKITLEEE